MTAAARSPRERYRDQVRDEIKALAWGQVATTGAAALSINAIAKEMGVSGPALYRYYKNRDELITELVLDAYRDLAAALQAATAPTGRPADDGPAARLAHAAAALRAWALAAPHRYLLIYGTPVPGYHAPQEATEVASTMMTILLDALAEAPAGGTPPPEAAAEFDRHLATHRQWAGGHPAEPDALRRALTCWTRMHGILSLEVAGHFAGMGFDPALLYASELESTLWRPGGGDGTASVAGLTVR
jgi:AcrR family transcriptional regulator